jgi:hypothetical protein
MSEVSKEKQKQYNQIYYHKHREDILRKCKEKSQQLDFKVKRKLYKLKTKEHSNLQRRQHYRNNSRSILVKLKEYRDIGLIRYWDLKTANKKHNIITTWSKSDFLEWFQKSDKVCYYCSCPLLMFSISDYNGYTLDRLDSTKGYNEDNVVFACRRCNTVKSKWLTSQQMLEIACKYFKNIGG